MDPQLKVSRAVTKAAFEHPFFGSCALSLGVTCDNSISTAATDGRKIIYNENFVDKLSEKQTLGLICHEVMHVILQHCQKWEHKDPQLCNIAMDYVINNSLVRDGSFELPEDGIFDEKGEFIGMTWQQVYAILDDVKDKYENGNFEKEGAADKSGMPKDRQEELGNQISSACSSGVEAHIIPGNLSEAEAEKLKLDIERLVVKAANDAKNSGRPGSIPGAIEELINQIREPSVDWTEVLFTTMQNSFPEDYTMRKPNRKFFGSYDLYMPSMEGTEIGTLAVGLDTSGSVTYRMKERFLSEINYIAEHFKPQRIILLYADYACANVEVYEQGEPIDVLNSRGGGGTSFVPVFDYIKDNDIHVDQMIYFSDMLVSDCCFPDEEPEYPVLWVSTDNKYDVPFGELVEAKDDA